MVKTKFSNFVIGGRVDRHNEYGTAFCPRLGIVGPFNKFHYKLIFSKAFRAPGIENINCGVDIKPEQTTVIEAEFGYILTSNMFITANLFDITIKDPIIYYYDAALDEEWYQNSAKTGSTGIELEYRLKYNWGYITANYSFASAMITSQADYFRKNAVDVYEVPDHPEDMLGLPQHKATIAGCYTWGNLSIDPSLVFLSQRYAWTGYDADENDVIVADDPSFRLNAYVSYRDFIFKRLRLGFGVFNILDDGYEYIQPYLGELPPHPGPSREFVIKLSYDVGF
jgi:outer membrane receptor protein involved in Fe transport